MSLSQMVLPSGMNPAPTGPSIVSEAMAYAMILAALYDDRASFDRLSATAQAVRPLASEQVN